MNDLETFLSKETISKYQDLVLDAFDWYQRTLIENDKQNESYIRDPRWSRPAAIRRMVEGGQDVPSGELRFLKVVLDGYEEHIASLGGKPWIRQPTIIGLLEKVAALRREL